MASGYAHPKVKKKSPREFFEEHIVSSDHSNLRLTVALMVGIFFGVAPIWGFQMLAIIGISILFNLNKPLSLLIAQISLPPFIPLVIFASYKIGGWFVGAFTSIPVHHVSFENKPTLADLSSGLFQYVIGAIVLGLILAAITGLVSFMLLNLFRKKGRMANKIDKS